MSFSDMKAYLTARGENERQEMITDGRTLISARLACDPSYTENAVIRRYSPKTDIPIGICLYSEQMTVGDGLSAKFSCAAQSDIETGDIVFLPDKEEYRLVTACSVHGEIIKSGTAALCQVFLRWQDESGEICEYPATDRCAAYYSDGVTSSGMIHLGASKHVLCLPADENTIKIRRGLRFFLDRNEEKPQVFIITQCDTTSLCFGRGIVRLIACEDEFNAQTDRKDLRLCDYRGPSPAPPQIAVTPDDGILRLGMSRLFTAQDEVSFALSTPDGRITLTQESANTCSVSVPADEALTGAAVVLSFTAQSGAEGELCLTVRGGV